MNVDLLKWGDFNYYQKNLASQYQLMIGKCGLELLDFRITWSRIKKNSSVFSALDHAFTNKPLLIHSYFKSILDYSDHSLICVELKLNNPKSQSTTITSRDLRKVRSNTKYFLKKLSEIKWETFVSMDDVENMEEFWTTEINNCLNKVAPWKSRKLKHKKINLPKEVQTEIKKRKSLQKIYQSNLINGIRDSDLEKQFKSKKTTQIN